MGVFPGNFTPGSSARSDFRREALQLGLSEVEVDESAPDRFQHPIPVIQFDRLRQCDQRFARFTHRRDPSGIRNRGVRICHRWQGLR